ncbi:hypothetical protein ABZW96_37025 [Nocardia sp. NPDC004168]|uniref:hypothetical protein n=1 Tax=Nocardia sp. NPDC004168 TaxID=3154452 RepID=UPI0033B0EAA4
MFEEWADQFDPPSYHVIDPPRRVMIDLGQFILAPESFARGVPLRVRNGVVVDREYTSALHAWARTSSGGWIAFVTCVVLTGNGKGRIWMRQWCSRQAVSLPDDEQRPSERQGRPRQGR